MTVEDYEYYKGWDLQSREETITEIETHNLTLTAVVLF